MSKSIKKKEIDDWDEGEIEEKVEMGAMELSELIEQRIEQGANKKETNLLIDEYNRKFGRVYSKL